jgi:hypothetical protein
MNDSFLPIRARRGVVVAPRAVVGRRGPRPIQNFLRAILSCLVLLALAALVPIPTRSNDPIPTNHDADKAAFVRAMMKHAW